MTDINRTACAFARPALNANTLKLIAVLAMVLDHAATVFLADTAPAALFFHAVGQVAAPIMCFFIAEGYTYTSNLKKYLLRLFIAAVISHVPYALCFKFTVWEFWYVTGVLWGLFLGLLAVTLWKRPRAPVWVRLLLLGLCCLLAYPANWNYIAVLWIFGFAVFRESPKKQWAFFGLVTLLYVLQYFVYGSTLPVWLRPFVLLCVPLLLCYNHTLGRRSKVLQWGYYLFYPAHLLVLTLLREIFTRL